MERVSKGEAQSPWLGCWGDLRIPLEEILLPASSLKPRVGPGPLLSGWGQRWGQAAGGLSPALQPLPESQTKVRLLADVGLQVLGCKPRQRSRCTLLPSREGAGL